jgi:hypothetical protein
MWNEPDKEQLLKIPKLYETEDVPLKDKLIHLHFFIGGCDWHVAEYDGEYIFLGLCHPERRHPDGQIGLRLILGT